MTANDLIAAFETLADAPDGVKRLRELVLQLAVRGKLVSGADGWPTVPLSDVVEDFQNGTSSRGGERGEPVVVLRLADIKQGRIVPSSFRKIDLSADSAAKYRVREGDVLAIRVNGSGDLVGRMILVEQSEGWCYCDHLIRVRLRPNTLVPRFLSLFGNTPDARDHLSSVTVTTAGQKTVNQKGLGSLRVPLPPLAEQHRIVARVDELMGLLDRLEAARTARDDVRRAARDAALAALRDAEDTDAVEAAWGRIAGQMDALFAEPGDVGRLRQAVLGLAVRGRLVPQDAKDEPSDKALARIDSERASKAAVSGARPKRPASDLVPPFSLPPTWRWVELVRVADVIDPNPSHRMPEYVAEGVPFISTENFVGGDLIDFSIGKKVRSDTLAAQVERFNIPKGAFAMSRIGTIGKTCILPTERFFCMSHALCVIGPFSSDISTSFLRLVVTSPPVLRQAQEGVNSIGTPDLGMGKIRSFVIPWPPSGEQGRIVAKVDALMALCDALEARLTSARDLHGQFAAAAVHHLDV